jgi:Cu/Ag efflux protein CusF
MRWLTALLLFACACGHSATYSGTGDVVAVDDPPRHVTIRHDDIPDLMPAMTMAFAVRTPAVLAGVAPGIRVRFQLVREEHGLVVTEVVPIGPAAGARPGLHDHTPHHGGVVAMAGLQHLEAVAAPDGQVRVYLSDVWRRPLPLDDVTGTVTLDLAGGKRVLALARGADALEARGPALAGPDVRARVQVAAGGEPLDLHFVLPLEADARGAALVPREGCVPPPASPGGDAGRRPRCVIGFPQPATVVAATPDGGTVLVAVVNAWVTAWRLPAGALAAGFAPPPPIVGPADETPHGEAANAVAVSPDGREAVVAVENRLLRYAVGSGRLLRQLPGPGGIVRHVAWSPAGAQLLVTAFYDPAAHLLAADDGRELRRIAVEHEASAVAFSADGRWAAVGSAAGPITVVDPAGDTPPRLLTGSARATEALVFCGDRLVSAAADGVLRVWDPARGVEVARTVVGSPLFHLAAAPGGDLVASVGFDRTIRLHHLAADGVTDALPWHRAAVAGLTWAGTTLVSGDADGQIALWDVAAPAAAPP